MRIGIPVFLCSTSASTTTSSVDALNWAHRKELVRTGLRTNIGQNLGENFREEICIFPREHQRRSQLYDVVKRSIRSSQNAAIAQAIHYQRRQIARDYFDAQK